MDPFQPGESRIIPLEFQALPLPDSEVCSYMGYGNAEPDSRILEMIFSMKSELNNICKPRFGYLPVTGNLLDRDSLTLEGRTVTPGKIITGYLKKSQFFILLVATAGTEYDSWRQDIQNSDDIVRQYVADSLGSAIAEAIVAQALDQLELLAGQAGIHISNSYSPGYCGWHVSEQQTLFSLLPDLFCGVRLTESSLMLPIKSVSALIGAGPLIARKPYGCAICSKKDCYKRRVNAA